MIKKFFELDEKQTLEIFCVVEIAILALAYFMVMTFLGGEAKDNIVLLMIVYCLVIYLLRNKYTYVAKCMLSCSSAFFAIITIVSDSGRYGAIASTFFLFLIISMSHYDKLQVVLSAMCILVTNIIGFLLFPQSYLKVHNTTVWCFILFIYVTAIICAYMITRRTHNLFQKEHQIQLSEFELAHLEQVEYKNKEHSKFIHNIHHYFTAIATLAHNQDYEKILNLLNDINMEISKHESVFFTAHRIMNGILAEKYTLAKSQNIAIDIYVEPSVKLKNISDGDIVIMFGNLLDNAIEAASKVEESKRFIKVRIYHGNAGKICVVKIENSFSTPVQYNKKGSLVSIKPHGLQGLGIKSVNDTAKKYGGFLKYNEKDNIFEAVLVLSEQTFFSAL